MAQDQFSNLATTTVTSGGTTAPASGTVESWTVASGASFPTVLQGVTQFRLQEDDLIRQSEVMLVTDTGAGNTAWTVVRGVEGTAPVAHPSGFTVVETITKGTLDALALPVVPLYEGESMLVYGHSFVIPTGVACTPGNEWQNRVASRLGMVPTAFGVGSSRMIDCFNDVQTGLGASAVTGSLWVESRRCLVLLEAMLNDAYNPADQTVGSPAVALTTAQVNVWAQTLQAFLAHVSAGSRVDASTGSKTGTWTTTSSTVQYNGGVLDRTQVQNSFIDITVTVPASGVVWGISYSVSGFTNGDMSITDVTGGGSIAVGNVLGSSIVGATIFSRRQVTGFIVNPFPFQMTGLTPGSRILRFKKTDSSSNFCYIDVLLPVSATPVPVGVVKDTIWPVSALTTGVTDSTAQGVGAANMALLRTAQDTAVAAFSNAFTIDMTNVTLVAGDYSATDGIHPNDRGMRKMARAAMRQVTTYLEANDPDGMYASITAVVAAPLFDSSRRSFIAGVTTLAGQSGAVTLDLSTGSVFLVTLTGNVTSWAFSNPGATGQDIEVHFIQDATGSRTLAGANASIRLAGSALTLTTTASHRDVVRFRQLAAGYYETARSLNLVS